MAIECTWTCLGAPEGHSPNPFFSAVLPRTTVLPATPNFPPIAYSHQTSPCLRRGSALLAFPSLSLATPLLRHRRCGVGWVRGQASGGANPDVFGQGRHASAVLLGVLFVFPCWAPSPLGGVGLVYLRFDAVFFYQGRRSSIFKFLFLTAVLLTE